MNKDVSTLPPSESHADLMSMCVVVTTWEDFEDLYEEDRGALGCFEVRVPCHLSPQIAAGAAMGAFHSTIPIKYLDCFEYKVYGEDGCIVEPCYDADWYSLAAEHHAFLVDWHHP